MYKVNDTVRYSPYGVCRIAERVMRKIGENEVDCFILKPIFNDNCNLLLPINNNAALSKLQPILTVQEIHELICAIPAEDTIVAANNTQHKKQFDEILMNGDRRMLIRMIKTLYSQQEKLTAMGKKLNSTDERYMQEAEKQLYEEFSYVLKIDPDEVLPLILKQNEAKNPNLRKSSSSTEVKEAV